MTLYVDNYLVYHLSMITVFGRPTTPILGEDCSLRPSLQRRLQRFQPVTVRFFAPFRPFPFVVNVFHSLFCKPGGRGYEHPPKSLSPRSPSYLQCSQLNTNSCILFCNARPLFHQFMNSLREKHPGWGAKKFANEHCA